MIYPGTDLKYKVTAAMAGFNLQDNDFRIAVKNYYGGVISVIEKDEMMRDEFGGFYFALNKLPAGTYYATMFMIREDEDFDEEHQQVVDTQYLVTVGHVQNNNCGCCASDGTDGAIVGYERVWIVNVEGGSYLVDAFGNPILDNDGNKIYLSVPSDQARVKLDMSAEQLKQLLEGHSDNGKIDTIPEVMDVMGGLDEDTEYFTMTDSDTDSMMNRILGRNNG